MREVLNASRKRRGKAHLGLHYSKRRHFTSGAPAEVLCIGDHGRSVAEFGQAPMPDQDGTGSLTEVYRHLIQVKSWKMARPASVMTSHGVEGRWDAFLARRSGLDPNRTEVFYV